MTDANENNVELGKNSDDIPAAEALLPTTFPSTRNKRQSGSCWKKRTTLEKSLFLLTCGLVVIVIGLIVFLFIKVEPNSNTQPTGSPSTVEFIPKRKNESNVDYNTLAKDVNNEVCATPTCVRASAVLKSAMDFSVDPCQDFYQFACGRWNSTNPIPEGRSNWDVFTRLQQDHHTTLQALLEQPSEYLTSESEKRAQRYYESCVDVNKTRQSLGGQPVLDLLDLIGGWPAPATTEVDEETKWNLQEAIQLVHNVLHTEGFFKWELGPVVSKEFDVDTGEIEVSSSYIIKLEQGGLTVSELDFYLDETNNGLRSIFTLLMSKAVLPLMRKGTTIRQLVPLVVQIIEFETRLAELFGPPVTQEENESHSFITIEDLNTVWAPFLNWTQYFQSAFSHVGISIQPSQSVAVSSLEYFLKLSALIDELIATEDGIAQIRNYLGWHIASGYLPKAFNKSIDASMLVGLSYSSEENSKIRCVKETDAFMGFAVGSMFVRQNVRNESKRLAESITDAIIVAFKNNLDNLDWMDEETREAAKDKADAIINFIGYPEFILNPNELDNYYGDLKIEADEYFWNNFRLQQFAFRKQLLKLGQPIDRTEWSAFTLSELMPQYLTTLNQITFPVGSLHPPLFDTSFPHSLNFGAMGAVVGHELTHAFDNDGHLYDGEGNLSQWWDDDTIEKFKERTECLVSQYSKYSNGGRPINGTFTLGENIADNGGLKAAFNAFKNWQTNRDEDLLPLPGLELTHKQLFFLSFAQVYCFANSEKEKDLEQQKDNKLKDPHSPEPIRVIGTLSNSPEFSSAFQCQPGSPMNPVEKCQVW